LTNYNSKFNKIIDTITHTENYTTIKYIKRKRNQELYNMIINKVESQTIYIIHTYITLYYIYLFINIITKCINEKLYNHATLRANFNITNLEQQIKKLKPSEHYTHILSTKLKHIKPTKVYEIKIIVDPKEPKYKFKFKFKSQRFTETIGQNTRHDIRNYQFKWLFYLLYIILNNNYLPQISTNKHTYLKSDTSFKTSTMSCTTIFKIPTILSYYLKTSKERRFCQIYKMPNAYLLNKSL